MKILRIASFILSGAVLLTLFVATPLASANSITYTAAVPQQLTDLTDVALTPSLPMYNLANTLTGVTITIQGAGTMTFNSVTNNGSGSSTFIATQNTSLWLDDQNSLSIDALLDPLTASISASSPGTVGSHNIISGGTVVAQGATVGPLGPYTMTGSLASISFSSPAELALFQGPVGGNSVLDFVMSTYSSTTFTTNGSNNLAAVYSELAGGTIQITYDYNGTPIIPEPTTLILFGTGLMGLAGAVRYKFMKSR